MIEPREIAEAEALFHRWRGGDESLAHACSRAGLMLVKAWRERDEEARMSLAAVASTFRSCYAKKDPIYAEIAQLQADNARLRAANRYLKRRTMVTTCPRS